MHQPFVVTGTILVQPTAASQIYTRSDSNESNDTSPAIVGLDDSDIGVSESVTLTAGSGKIEQLYAGLFDALSQIHIDDGPADGTISIFNGGMAGQGTISFGASAPSDNDTIRITLGGLTANLYRFKTSLSGSSAFDVLIGGSSSAAADNLKRAINHDATAGTNYNASTPTNPYVSAAVSGTIITYTDRIPCHRLLGWNVGQTVGSSLSIASPIGGTDGTLLLAVDPGDTSFSRAMTLSTEDLTTATLRALTVPTTDYIRLAGRSCCLRFKGAGITTSIPLKYQTSTDHENWANGVSSIANISNSHTIAAPQVVVPTERNIEYIRLVFTGNTNTASTKIDARVINSPA